MDSGSADCVSVGALEGEGRCVQATGRMVGCVSAAASGPEAAADASSGGGVAGTLAAAEAAAEAEAGEPTFDARELLPPLPPEKEWP